MTEIIGKDGEEISIIPAYAQKDDIGIMLCVSCETENNGFNRAAAFIGLKEAHQIIKALSEIVDNAKANHNDRN